jgi:hypothetical protein
MATQKEVNEALSKVHDLIAPLFPESYEIDIEITPRKTTLTEHSAYQEFTFVKKG